MSRKEAFARLEGIGEDPTRLDAILITHEHCDHVSGLPALARPRKDGKRAPAVYLTHLTAPTIDWGNGVRPELRCFQAGSAFQVGDLEIRSFTVPHDAIDPVGFTVTARGVKIGVCTDLGYIPDSVKWHLRDTRFLILESNHDIEMLKVGPYPWSVKQRVLSRKGHLSNDLVCDYIKGDLPPTVETLVLGHLSENNNHPAIVELSAKQALFCRGADPRLVIADPRRASEAFSA